MNNGNKAVPRWITYYVTAMLLLGAVPCYPMVIKEHSVSGRSLFVESLKEEIFLGTNDRLYRWVDGRAVPVTDIKGDTEFVTEAGGEVWLGTDEGLYRLSDGRAFPVTDIKGYPRIVREAGGEAWLATYEGLYRWVDGQAVDVPGIKGFPTIVTEGGGEIWLLQTHIEIFRQEATLYRWVDGRAVPVTDIKGTQGIVTEVGGEVWLGTEKGLYRLSDGQAVDVPGIKGFPRIATEAGGEIWLLNAGIGIFPNEVESTLYRWVDGRAVPVTDIKGDTEFVTEAGGEVWLGTDEGLYRLSDGRAFPVTDIKGYPRIVREAGGEVWLATNKGLYRWVDGQAVDVPGIKGMLENVEVVDGEVWLTTVFFERYRGGPLEDTLYRWVDGRAVPVTDIKGDPRIVREAGGEVWLATNKGLYRWVDGRAVDVPGIKGMLENVEVVDGEVWLTTRESLHRWVDADATYRLVSTDSWWKNAISTLWPDSRIDGEILLDGEISVKVNVSGPDAVKVPRDRFSFILETNPETFQAKLEDGRFSDEGKLTLAATGFGRQETILMAVKNLDGTITQKEFTRWVFPSSATAAGMLVIFWLLLWGLIIAFASRNVWFMSILMNPFLRKVGSACLIPLVISIFPPMQRHLFKLYRRELLKTGVIRDALSDYQRPDSTRQDQTPHNIFSEHQRVYVTADSGYGKTMLSRYLTGVWARHPDQAPKRAIPIYLGLSQFNGVEPIKMIRGQLSNHGNLTDTKLVDWLFEQGGFIVIFDGLNEVSGDTRNKIATFVQNHWQRNYFLMTSQYPRSWPEFHCINLEPLQPAAIRKIIRQRLPSQAEAIVERLTDDQYKLFSRPQDLNLALEILATTPSAALPNEEGLLYQSLFSPKFEEWKARGLKSYKEWLQAEAYRMVRDSKPMDGDAPEDVVTFLRDKHLVSLTEGIYFSHGLVRAYLAAQHFAPQWQTLIAEDESQIDDQWFDVFTFSTAILIKDGGSEVLKDIANKLLHIDDKLSIRYVKWLKEHHYSVCEPWLEEFEKALGAHSLASD